MKGRRRRRRDGWFQKRKSREGLKRLSRKKNPDLL